MYKKREIRVMNFSEKIKYVGVNDTDIDLFEGQYAVQNGMCYNSYVILDEKIAVMDTVDKTFGKEWLEKIAEFLDGKAPDYLIVQHMEPDHSSNICEFIKAYPNTTVVSSSKSFAMMKNFFCSDYSENRIEVKEGDTLDLGEHKLHFITAPMVHWPEVIMTYEETEKVLFSADAFGKFGRCDIDEPWEDEARRYYIGIVGKFGMQVQALLKKTARFEINTICSLHGPVLTENVQHYIDLYDTWSAYKPEEEGVLIAYASIYGNTKEGAELLASKLKEKGIENVELRDLSRCDLAEAVATAFKLSKTVFASSTYNGTMFPPMKIFIDHLTDRNYQGRTVAFMENGSWAPTATKAMQKLFETSKNLTYCENSVKILSSLNDDSINQIDALAEELTK